MLVHLWNKSILFPRIVPLKLILDLGHPLFLLSLQTCHFKISHWYVTLYILLLLNYDVRIECILWRYFFFLKMWGNWAMQRIVPAVWEKSVQIWKWMLKQDSRLPWFLILGLPCVSLVFSVMWMVSLCWPAAVHDNACISWTTPPMPKALKSIVQYCWDNSAILMEIPFIQTEIPVIQLNCFLCLLSWSDAYLI